MFCSDMQHVHTYNFKRMKLGRAASPFPLGLTPSQRILTESCVANVLKEAMFFDGMCIAICVTLTNLNHNRADLNAPGMNVRMHVRMTDLYECRKIVYLFIMKSPINNLNRSWETYVFV
jgi:hypothetical protein